MAAIIVKIIWLSVIVTWYRPEYWAELHRIEVLPETTGCSVPNVCPTCVLVACYSARSYAIHVDARSPLVRDGLLHESLHHFQGEVALHEFRLPALRYARELRFLSVNELHAQLPNVLGYIPADLQEWYPWLRKERG